MPPNSQGKPWAADIQLTPNGKYLYASERTSSTLSGFKVDAATGKMTPVGSARPSSSRAPSRSTRRASSLYAVGEKSDSMTSYAIDAGRAESWTKLQAISDRQKPELGRDRRPSVIAPANCS